MTTTPLSLSRLARAKINLYLHVAPPETGGYHSLQSLVMFADIGDKVFLRPKSMLGAVRLSIDGPFGSGLPVGGDNLILRAVKQFEAETKINIDNHDIHLEKQLPIASGLGGGSADAGAVLHLLRDHYAPDMSDDDLEAVAVTIGADGIMCLWSAPALAEGYGERLTPLDLPELAAVLINPGIGCSTPAVYSQYDKLGSFAPIEAHERFQAIVNIDVLIDALTATRNDLEAPAVHLHPQIGELLARLSAEPETRLARMSGSGATCFALCDRHEDALYLAQRLQADYPQSWVRACTLS